METTELIRIQLNQLVTQARYDIQTLASSNELANKQQILQRLWDSLSSIQFLGELLANEASGLQKIPTNQLPPPSAEFQRLFTLQELSVYDGKNGMPAYVAVNNTVHDVTNNKAWAAASHFGLSAGKDFTQEFSSCHAGQQSILSTLPIVGRLQQ